MGKLGIATTECNYKEMDKQLKEQFIHGPNDSEIIKELTEIEENDNMTSEQVLVWHRRVEAQKAQSAILENVNKTKDFNKTVSRNRGQDKTGCNHKNRPECPQETCRYIGFSHPHM